MASYIYMKILESQPERYDRGIQWLSLGQALKVKRRLIEENVGPGARVLEIGAGTGTMALMAAKKGASVLGFDVSPAMLAVARKKVGASGLADRIELQEMGVSGMDHLPEASFDLVMSTLVFSELSPEEQAYALKHALRTLKPGGRLALADEVAPRSVFKRFVHGLIRFPLLIITFARTQTTTRPVSGLEEKVIAAGFQLQTCARSGLDNFLYLVAEKEQSS